MQTYYVCMYVRIRRANYFSRNLIFRALGFFDIQARSAVFASLWGRRAISHLMAICVPFHHGALLVVFWCPLDCL
jgi:hypothetical protein